MGITTFGQLRYVIFYYEGKENLETKGNDDDTTLDCPGLVEPFLYVLDGKGLPYPRWLESPMLRGLNTISALYAPCGEECFFFGKLDLKCMGVALYYSTTNYFSLLHRWVIFFYPLMISSIELQVTPFDQ